MLIIETYAQQDKRWGNLELVPGYPMSRWGCFVTSLAMKLRLTPDKVLDKLKEYDGIDPQGMMTYDGVQKAFPEVHFIERVYTKDDPSRNFLKMETKAALDKVRRYLDLGQAVVLCVDNVGDDGIPDHAVLAHGYGGDDFRIKDPDHGRDIWLSEKYGKVYGYVGLVSPPDSYPDGSPYKNLGGAFWKAAEIRAGRNVSTYSREIVDSFLSV